MCLYFMVFFLPQHQQPLQEAIDELMAQGFEGEEDEEQAWLGDW